MGARRAAGDAIATRFFKLYSFSKLQCCHKRGAYRSSSSSAAWVEGATLLEKESKRKQSQSEKLSTTPTAAASLMKTTSSEGVEDGRQSIGKGCHWWEPQDRRLCQQPLPLPSLLVLSRYNFPHLWKKFLLWSNHLTLLGYLPHLLYILLPFLLHPSFSFSLRDKNIARICQERATCAGGAAAAAVNQFLQMRFFNYKSIFD